MHMTCVGWKIYFCWRVQYSNSGRCDVALDLSSGSRLSERVKFKLGGKGWYIFGRVAILLTLWLLLIGIVLDTREYILCRRLRG